MRPRIRCNLLLAVGLLLAACSAGQSKIVTLEVPHVVREIQYVTVEVPRIEREIQFATVEVTRIVRETVIVTPGPPPDWRVDVSPGMSLSLARTWHTATLLFDGRILLVGGSNGMDDHYSLVELYDSASGAFIQAAPLHTPRSGHTATLLRDNRVLVVGGYNYQQQWLQDAEVYDPYTNTWTVLPPIYPHGVQHTATLLPDGRVLVVGGCIGSGVCTNRVEIFDPLTNSWTEAAALDAERASHGAALLNDGRVLVAGGASAGYDTLLYDPLSNSWSAGGAMAWPRAQAAMTRLQDGRVLVAGGINISDAPITTASTEIYDPGTNAWTAGAPLAQPRYAHSLFLMMDTQVLAIGGAHAYDYPQGHPNGNPWSASSFAQDLESYDLRTDRWYKAGELVRPQAYAASAPLPDGRLWVTGGGAGSDMAKAWADTWLLAPRVSQP